MCGVVMSCGRQENGRSEIPAKKTYDISGKEAIQALLFFSLALTVYLETVHQPNRSSDKPHCHICKRPTNYPQPAMLLLYGDSAISSLLISRLPSTFCLTNNEYCSRTLCHNTFRFGIRMRDVEMHVLEPILSVANLDKRQ